MATHKTLILEGVLLTPRKGSYLRPGKRDAVPERGTIAKQTSFAGVPFSGSRSLGHMLFDLVARFHDCAFFINS